MRMTKHRGIERILAEEAERFEREKDLPRRYSRVGRPPKPVAERGQVYAIRLPTERLEEFRRMALSQGKPPAVLAREWILERLGEPRIVHRSARKPAAKRGARKRATAAKQSPVGSARRRSSGRAIRRKR